jgi:hypothetical protein
MPLMIDVRLARDIRRMERVQPLGPLHGGHTCVQAGYARPRPAERLLALVGRGHGRKPRPITQP